MDKRFSGEASKPFWEAVERVEGQDNLTLYGFGCVAREIEASRNDLRTIVAKLPKCWRLVDGKRVQDVPMVPKGRYRTQVQDPYEEDRDEWFVKEVIWWKGGGDDCFNPEYTLVDDDTKDTEQEFFSVKNVSLTREAAEAKEKTDAD